AGAEGLNWRNRSRVSGSGFPSRDRETSSERSGESGIDRATRGPAPERTEAGRQRTRSTGRATNCRTCRSQRKAEKGNCRTQAGGREATSRGEGVETQ